VDTSDNWPTIKKGANDSASNSGSNSHAPVSGTVSGRNKSAAPTNSTSTTAVLGPKSTESALASVQARPKKPANSTPGVKTQPSTASTPGPETKGNRGGSQLSQSSDLRNGAGPKNAKGNSNSVSGKSAAGAGCGRGLTDRGEGGQHDSSGDLVSYLQQTGSILALAEMLDGADADDVTDEDMRLLQEAASARQVTHTANGPQAKAN